MQTFEIKIAGRLQEAGIPGPADGAYRLSASSPAVALKRLLDGGHAAGYKFATVGRDHDKLALRPGQWIAISIKRI